MSAILRRIITGTYELTGDEATSPAIPFHDRASGAVRIPAGSPITQITWYASLGGDYSPAYDADGVAVTQTVAADRVYPIPEALFGAHDLKAVVTGGTAGSVAISLKG